MLHPEGKAALPPSTHPCSLIPPYMRVLACTDTRINPAWDLLVAWSQSLPAPRPPVAPLLGCMRLHAGPTPYNMPVSELDLHGHPALPLTSVLLSSAHSLPAEHSWKYLSIFRHALFNRT